MTWESVLNIAGLVMSMGGVILLFYFGMPYRVRTGGYSTYVGENSDPKEARTERWYDVLGRLGLTLILVGTAAQIGALLPKRANAPALHRLRRLANRVLHGEIDEFSRPDTTRRDFELEIVSLLFVLRALIEGAPQASVTGPRHFR